MGRRHLILLAASVAAVALVGTAAAGLTWRTVGDGPATGPTVTTAVGYLATSRSSALSEFGTRLSTGAKASLAKLDFSRNVLVAVFGEYGCNDANIVTSALTRHGSVVTVKLVPKPPAPGIATCQALFPTYRFLAVPRSALAAPLPTRVVVDFA